MTFKTNLTGTGKTNSYGHEMAHCTGTYDDSDTTYPVTLNGTSLDAYCNHIDSVLDDLLNELTDLGPNHPLKLAFNPSAIPSESQRRAFMLMRELLDNARSLAGTLRYDVSVVHDGCIMHDEHVYRNVDRIIGAIGNFKETYSK
jgi:hypothetical protein